MGPSAAIICTWVRLREHPFPAKPHPQTARALFHLHPQAKRALWRYAMLGVTGVTILGLLKLNLTGPGITETYKSLWREPPKEEH